MKKIVLIIAVGILFLSGFEAVGTSDNNKMVENGSENVYAISFDDITLYKYYTTCEGKVQDFYPKPVQNTRLDYPIGETIWQYTLTQYDPSPKAIAPIPDINDDGIDDVIVCSEDDHVRCFDGGAIGSGVVLWEHEIYAGDVYNQNGIAITEDIDNDGYSDVVVGAAWGARLIRCISGKDGDEIWTHDTHEYGGGGWVYMVDCSYDYNGDDILDVLASTGDDSSDTGPKRVYCLDGVDGMSIWERQLGGPVFSVIGIEDFTGDGQPDVLAGCSNEGETVGYAKGIRGDTGGVLWTYTTPGSSVWALEQINDITDDGIKDVIIGDFSGNIRGLDATNGNVEYSSSLGSAIITRFAKLTDVNGDGHPDIVPAHSTVHTTQAIDGQTGDFIWTHSVADQPWNVARTSDISGDGIDDVLVGTLYNSNYCYFLDGTDGSELESIPYGQAVDAIMAIPDVVNDNSMEMVAGGRDGKLTCISGGLDALVNDPPGIPEIDGPIIGAVGKEYEFIFSSIDPDDNDVYYYIEWGDGEIEEWDGPYHSGEQAIVSHTWTSPDVFNIRAKAKDIHDEESEWSNVFPVEIVENNPPNTPDIEGETSGNIGVLYTYKFTSIDPDNNDVYFIINWDDDSAEEIIGPFPSGVEGEAKHRWTSQGTFTIEVKAKDFFGEESDLATLEVTITKTRVVYKPFIRFLEEQLYSFPIIKLLLQLLGL